MQVLIRSLGAVTLALSILGAPAGAAPQCHSSYIPGDAGPAPGDHGHPADHHPEAATPKPTGPAPGSPNGPGPGMPNTPGPKTPRGGMIIPMTRQTTSKAILAVDWDCPVAESFRKSGSTYAAKGVMSRVEALRFIAGKDSRPLLILRECTKCRGTEHALFHRRLKNERIKLLLNWFHCVKLPPEVLKPTHPFHRLFFEPKKRSSVHLLIATTDGVHRTEFSGLQSQSLMRNSLVSMIEKSYEKKPNVALRSMLKHLSQFDRFDLREVELLRALDREAEGHGLKTSKHKKLTKELVVVRAQKAKSMKTAIAVCDLKLRIVDVKKKSD